VLVKKTVYLKTDTLLALRQMAEARGRNRQEFIREAVNAYVRESKRTDSGAVETPPRRGPIP